MSRFRSVLALVATASLAVSCLGRSASQTASPSSVSGSPVAPTVDQLAGTWNLVSIQPAGEPEQATPPGANYTLTFTDGRLSTRVDCNVCNGVFMLSGQTLTAGPALACTRAACPTMGFESGYTRLLSGDSNLAVAGNTLVLTSPRGVLRFIR